MPKNLIVCIILSFMLTFPGCETTGGVEGTAILENASEYSGVKINLKGTEFITTTQSNGTFQILNVPAGPYKIVAEKEGFISVEKEIEVIVGQVTMVKFVLLPEIPMPPSLPKP